LHSYPVIQWFYLDFLIGNPFALIPVPCYLFSSFLLATYIKKKYKWVWELRSSADSAAPAQAKVFLIGTHQDEFWKNTNYWILSKEKNSVFTGQNGCHLWKRKRKLGHQLLGSYINWSGQVKFSSFLSFLVISLRYLFK
jgi:hypothetical protein